MTSSKPLSLSSEFDRAEGTQDWITVECHRARPLVILKVGGHLVMALDDAGVLALVDALVKKHEQLVERALTRRER